MPLIDLDEDLDATIDRIRNALGEDSEESALVALLGATLTALALRCQELEGVMQGQQQALSSTLATVRDNLAAFRSTLAASEADITAVRQRLADQLGRALDADANAKDNLAGLLQTYADFDAAKKQMFSAVAGLATTGLAFVNPALATAAAPLLEQTSRKYAEA